jgi:hypothetical protein
MAAGEDFFRSDMWELCMFKFLNQPHMKDILNLLILTICLQGSSSSSYKSGYYYTKEGVKTEGLIEFHRASFSIFGSRKSHISFKENEDANSVRLNADDIPCFVIGNDSFATVYNIQINSVSGKYAKDFAKILVKGKMNLYMHMSSSGDGRNSYDNDRYVLSKDGKKFLGIWNPKDQRNEIADLFADNPDLQSRIRNKEYDKKIYELVIAYNSN